MSGSKKGYRQYEMSFVMLIKSFFKGLTIASLINGLNKCWGQTKIKVKQMSYFLHEPIFVNFWFFAESNKCHPYVLGRTNAGWTNVVSNKCCSTIWTLTWGPKVTRLLREFLHFLATYNLNITTLFRLENGRKCTKWKDRSWNMYSYLKTLSSYGCRIWWRMLYMRCSIHYMIELISWDDIIKVNNCLTGSNHLV